MAPSEPGGAADDPHATDTSWSIDRLTDNGRRAFGEAMEADAAADPWAAAAVGAGRLN